MASLRVALLLAIAQTARARSATLAAIVRYLRSPLGAHVLAVFFDVSSLHQHPRTPAQDAAFGAALGVMADGYASALGTCVARFDLIPPCPAELAAGRLCARAPRARARASPAASRVGKEAQRLRPKPALC